MGTLDVEQVDLAVLLAAIRTRVESPLAGSVVGRTHMRDVVADHLGCSALEAERLVDTMVSRGFVHLERDVDGRETWRLSRSA